MVNLLASLKVIEQDGKKVLVLDNKLDNESVNTINIVNNAITKDKLSEELINEINGMASNIADLMYEAISISSFTNNKGTVEIGTTITDVTLSWKTNKVPITLTLDGTSIDVNLTSKSITNLSITHSNNKTWTLKATDERGTVVSKTTSINFYNGVYYGASEEPSSYDSAFILSLTKTLRNNKLSTFNMTANSGQYIYYCIPTRFGTCEFTVGGFTGGFSLIDTIQFTNASGYTENYYVYRSDETNLGKTDVNVK